MYPKRIESEFKGGTLLNDFYRLVLWNVQIALVILAVFVVLCMTPAFAGRNQIENGEGVVIFYLDAQYRPVTKLERLGTVSEGKKAILAMYALQVGGGCAGHDNDGLKCELTRSLGLGAQCSDQHLSLVRSWFRKEIPPMSGYPEHTVQRVLKSGDFKSICYNAPYTATRQVIWEVIRLSKDKDRVFVDAISRWTASADGPSGQDRYQTEYRINADTVTVIAHEKRPVPRNVDSLNVDALASKTAKGDISLKMGNIPDQKALCKEFGDHLNKPVRLSPFALEGDNTHDGTENIQNVDIDGDKIDDKVVRFCPGSGSIIPADPCTLHITLSSSGKSFAFEEQRFYLIRYKSGFYVVAGRMTDEKGPVRTDIYRLETTGIKQLCSYDCGLTGDCKKYTVQQ